jgi:hypothetical protein
MSAAFVLGVLRLLLLDTSTSGSDSSDFFHARTESIALSTELVDTEGKGIPDLCRDVFAAERSGQSAGAAWKYVDAHRVDPFNKVPASTPNASDNLLTSAIFGRLPCSSQ